MSSSNIFNLLGSLAIFCIGFAGWVFLDFVAAEFGSPYATLAAYLSGLSIILLCTVASRKILGSWKDALIFTAVLIICFGGAIAVSVLSKNTPTVTPEVHYNIGSE